MCHDGTGLRCERTEVRFWGVMPESRPSQTAAQEPRSACTRSKATLENRLICAGIAVRSWIPATPKRAAQGRKAAPAGGPIGTKSGGSITPKSGGPIRTKSGGSNHAKSCSCGNNAFNRGAKYHRSSAPSAAPRAIAQIERIIVFPMLGRAAAGDTRIALSSPGLSSPLRGGWAVLISEADL